MNCSRISLFLYSFFFHKDVTISLTRIKCDTWIISVCSFRTAAVLDGTSFGWLVGCSTESLADDNIISGNEECDSKIHSFNSLSAIILLHFMESLVSLVTSVTFFFCFPAPRNQLVSFSFFPPPPREFPGDYHFLFLILARDHWSFPYFLEAPKKQAYGWTQSWRNASTPDHVGQNEETQQHVSKNTTKRQLWLADLHNWLVLPAQSSVYPTAEVLKL